MCTESRKLRLSCDGPILRGLSASRVPPARRWEFSLGHRRETSARPHAKPDIRGLPLTYFSYLLVTTADNILFNRKKTRQATAPCTHSNLLLSLVLQGAPKNSALIWRDIALTVLEHKYSKIMTRSTISLKIWQLKFFLTNTRSLLLKAPFTFINYGNYDTAEFFNFDT